MTIKGAMLSGVQPSGKAIVETQAWEQWGNGAVAAAVDLPVSGIYEFTLRAAVKPRGPDGALSEIRIDQIPVAAGSGFTRQIKSTSPADYRWAGYVAKGPHELAVSLMNRDDPGGPTSLIIGSVTVSADIMPAGRRPADLPGPRDPTRHPYRSSSVWNTPIGSDAVWSAPGDVDTRELRWPGSSINAGEWSMPFYRVDPTEPELQFTDDDKTYPMASVRLHLSPDAKPAGPVNGGDHHMIVIDKANHTAYHFFNCRRSASGFDCSQSQKDDLCGEALGGYGWGAGVIRKWEIESGEIRHMLRYALSVKQTKAGTSWISGLAWPAMRSDYNGPRGLYTGHVLYGSTIGLPAAVDIKALGLSRDGLVLARALQDFGAIQRDTGGSGGIKFYAEESAEGMAQLDAMRDDLGKIVPHLAILRNQGPDTVNGGGKRLAPPVEGLDPKVCAPSP